MLVEDDETQPPARKTLKRCSKTSWLHSRPQRPRSFWSAPRIATSGLVQRHSVFEWLCKHNRLRPEPIRFVKLDSEHAQSDGKSVNRGLNFRCWTWPEVAILGADQKERGLWGRECRGCKMTSTRQHLAHLLKYYPRRPCAPSLIKSRFFRSTTFYLLLLTSLHF